MKKVEGLPGYIGDLRETLANEYQWKAIRDLPKIVKDGRPTEEIPISVQQNIATSND